MATTLVVHGHFYQPPRENPWTGALDREPSAAPFQNWNARVHAECYRANAFARVLDNFGRIERIVDNYRHLSFNFGPTVLSWMERADAVTYRRILAADAESVRHRGGHGNAIAQGYNHAILPLCNARDRRTQVRWGLADFTARFGRAAESMWLPETAADDATLGELIDAGMRYVILAPSQAQRVRRFGGEWRDVGDGSIDPGVAYRYHHRDGSGRSLAIFFYDGPVSRAMAFEGALHSSQSLVSRLCAAAGSGDGRLVHVATDGETYGHHHKWGERTLAYALTAEAERAGLRVGNYGQYLDEHPPGWEVEIKGGEGTAWSCAHGVGRWIRDCGCSTGAREGWNQKWRGPLRRGLDLLRDWMAARYEELAGELLADPWAARDAYVDVVLEPARRDAWFATHARRALDDAERVTVLTLLEAQRHGLLMYTSCGWFFADISGIETLQVMRYAARAMDLMDDLDLTPPREAVLEAMAEARSNLPELGTGADVWRRWVELGVTPSRAAAHVAISGLVEGAAPSVDMPAWRSECSTFVRDEHGRLALATARVELEHRHTGRRHDFAIAALYMGGVDFYAVVRPSLSGRRFQAAMTRVWDCFRDQSLAVLLRTMQKELGPDEFGLEAVLPSGGARISALVLGDVVTGLTEAYVRAYEQNARLLERLHAGGFELPRELRAAAEVALAQRCAAALLDARGADSPRAYWRAAEIADEAARHGFDLDRAAVGEVFANVASEAVELAVASRAEGTIQAAVAVVRLAERLHLHGELERAQEELWLLHEAHGGDWPEELAPLAGALRFAPTPWTEPAAR